MKLYQALKIAFTPAWLMLPLIAVNAIGLPVNSVVRGIPFDTVHVLVLLSSVIGYTLWFLSLRLFSGVMISLLWRKNNMIGLLWRKNKELPKISMIVLGLIFTVVGWFLVMPIFITYQPSGI